MPELPEVETIVRALKHGGRGGSPLIGLTIDHAALLWPRTLAPSQEDVTLAQLSGQVVNDITRRGKFIHFHLQDLAILIHLRMSGDLRVTPQRDGELNQLEKHDRFVLYFNQSLRMTFNDTRKFGRVWLLQDPQEILGKLGPEPFDEQLDGNMFSQMLQSSQRQIKPLLMDQSFLAGMGNIYTDEALYLARIHPLQRSHRIGNEQAARLLSAIRQVLAEGIRRNGASIDWMYRGGDFQNHFNVYQRTGQPCPRCGQPIQRMLVGQRGTHYCPHCQTRPAELQGV